MAFLVGSGAPGLQRLAVPFASLLIAVLGYGSQWLFAHAPDLEPGPLTPAQTRLFNTLLVCLWWTYWRACTVDPGRYEFPRPGGGGNSRRRRRDDGKSAAAKRKGAGDPDSAAAARSSGDDDDDDEDEDDNDGSRGGRGGDGLDDRVRAAIRRRRWCRKCAAPKPPRAHHCKSCGRCIPRMDHHCPWTGNCVGLQTFPHFARFIAYTNASLWMLLYLLGQRFRALWAARHLPAYLGPTPGQLAALTALAGAAGLTALALGVLLVTTTRGWLFNMTMIEGWELERHEAVLQRGGYAEEDWWDNGDDNASPPTRSVVDPVEFPYDVGVFANMGQAMGSPNPFHWLLPFAGGPRVARLPPGTALEDLAADLATNGRGSGGRGLGLGVGWTYEENGLNDKEGMWPPVDPDKARNARLWRRRRREEARYRREEALGLRNPASPDAVGSNLSPEEVKAAFRRRQERDLQRWRRRGDLDPDPDPEREREQIMAELEETPYRYRYGNSFGDEGEGGYAGAEPYRAGRRRVVRSEGESGWVNADGEHLGDYGVDEDAEFDDIVDDDGDDDFIFDDGPTGDLEDNNKNNTSNGIDLDDEEVPLAELIRRRKVRTKDGEDT